MDHPLTMTQLADRVARHCEIPGDNSENKSEVERATANAVTSIGVSYLAKNQPYPNNHERRAFYRHIRANMHRKRQEERHIAETQGPDKCRFAFLLALIGAVFSWLIEKAMDCLWENYKQQHAAGQSGVYIGMAGKGLVKLVEANGFCDVSAAGAGAEGQLEFDEPLGDDC